MMITATDSCSLWDRVVAETIKTSSNYVSVSKLHVGVAFSSFSAVFVVVVSFHSL